MTAGDSREIDRVDLGALYLGDGRCQFRVWAPNAGAEAVRLQCDAREPVSMTVEPNGYHSLRLDDVAPGTRYRYILSGGNARPDNARPDNARPDNARPDNARPDNARPDNARPDNARPDPASRFQPEGVHGPSEVVDPAFPWTDGAWVNPPLAQYVFYEMHVGTFGPAGTLEAIVPRLPYLKDLGVTAIELMPLAQFPGERNWGYDGVFPYAVQNSYGGPRALKCLVNAAHAAGLAVVLDVVYNHLGPEGNYLRDFGPYFTDRYKTPWGDALNFDGPDSDEVRRFFIGNALYWTTEFHVDALRLDAIHAIVESSARPFLRELALAVKSAGRAYVIAESDLNDVRVIRPEGLACDALWSDSLHHSLHTMLTGERDGYYQDYGYIADLAKAYTEGFVYSGQYSKFRRRRHGNSARGSHGEQFVVCAQNHDQIGNRAQGDRLTALVDFESLKLAAGAVIFSPFLPLLFMGEEYGETAPFLYFTSHGDAALVDAVRRGRQEEFAAFFSHCELPDPQDEGSFSRCRLTPEDSWKPRQRLLREFYRELIRLRRSTPALAQLAMERCRAIPLGEHALLIHRWCDSGEALLLFEFATNTASLKISCPGGPWSQVLHSAAPRWGGAGSAPAVLDGECEIVLPPRSLALYERR